MARWRFWNVFSILPIFSDSLSMKCFKIPISLRKLTLILRFLLKMKLLKFVSRMKVVFFESVKEKEKELSHTLIIEQMCRNERVFQLFPPISWWGCAACCKKGACNFSTSHFVNHLRWFENMQRRLTGIRHMKSNYLHAIFLSSWDEEKHKLQTCSKKSVLKLLQNPKISTS